jgi:glycosyl transferase family 2
MLDVLVTVIPTTRPAWVEQAVASVYAAAAAAGYPVRPMIVPGVMGHVGLAMTRGFDVTTAPYVAWVDNDDYVLPQAFACLAPHFAGNPKAICTREIQEGARGQQRRVDRRHHLTAFRRDVLEEWRPAIAANVAGLTSTLEAQELLLFGKAPEVVDVMEYVYVWRRYMSGGLALRNQAKLAAA